MPAATLANAAGAELQDVVMNAMTTQSGATRRFVERQLQRARVELSASEAAFRAFREQNLRFGNAPRLLVEQARLTRELAEKETVVAALTRQYEMARLDESREGPLLQVIDVATLADTINRMVDQLSSFAAEVTRVAREVGSEGRLGSKVARRGNRCLDLAHRGLELLLQIEVHLPGAEAGLLNLADGVLEEAVRLLFHTFCSFREEALQGLRHLACFCRGGGGGLLPPREGLVPHRGAVVPGEDRALPEGERDEDEVRAV